MLKMEWCANLCEGWEAERLLKRGMRVLAVLLALFLLMAEGENNVLAEAVSDPKILSDDRAGAILENRDMISGRGFSAGSDKMVSAPEDIAAKEYEEDKTSVEPDVAEAALMTDIPDTFAGISLTVPNQRDFPAINFDSEQTSGEHSEDLLPQISTEPVEDITQPAPDEEDVEGPSGMPEQGASEDEIKDITSSDDATDIPSDTGTVTEDGGNEDTAADNGYLIDESGIIYGISDAGLSVEDGCLYLPSEGCSGIAKGAFLSAPAYIEEVYIPSNITWIAEGAFVGLANVGWYEMEPSGGYYTENGVLFSDGGACILAFPAGWTGIYAVPPSVVRLAEDAFAGSSLEKLDTMSCGAIELGNLPESVSVF